MAEEKCNLPPGRCSWIAALITLVVVGCAPMLGFYPKMNQDIQNGQYDAALDLIEKNRSGYSERNAVLYYLDLGMVAHYGGYYEQSNQALARAEALMQELYTRSISREVSTYLINDNTTAYRGEDFESAMVNLFMALNYAGLQQWDDALVEARKVDVKLNMFNAQYGANEKNAYAEDAFIRFLMGVLYEADNEVNDAFISYEKAESIYRGGYSRLYGLAAPELLLKKYLVTAAHLQFNDEIQSLLQIYPRLAMPALTQPSTVSEVYLIHYNGLGAEKVPKFFLVPMPDKYILKLAYPAFQNQPCRVAASKAILQEVNGERSFELSTVTVEDISAIARTNLDNRIMRIKLKAIARVTAKYIAAKEAEKKVRKEHGDNWATFTRIFSQAAMIATEQADTRHWRTLPSQIRMGRAKLPPGTYRGSVLLLDGGGGTLQTIPLNEFSVEPGEKRILTVRSLQ